MTQQPLPEPQTTEPPLAPPLADVLLLAAGAWRRLRTGAGADRALAAAQLDWQAAAHPRLAAAARDVLYTATRHWALIEAVVARLAPRPPAAPIEALLAVALGQLFAPRQAEYVLVDQAVEAAKARDETRAAAGFVNAVLRRALRNRAALRGELEEDDCVRYNAPRWWIERLWRAYPQAWQSILAAQAGAPPLVLRVNRRRMSVVAYLQRLANDGRAATQVGEVAVWLHAACAVEAIPGFAAGDVSVQDAGSQLAAQLLGVADGMRVLDACAAPGGKTGHLTELADLSLDAVEQDGARALRIEQNLSRLDACAGSSVRVIVADVAAPGTWARPPYDRVLLDAPCTASGIVRRHPDIPWLRRPDDVAQLATAQARLLEALWPLVGPAGRLLYVVCSVFPEEGVRRVRQFLAQREDAVLVDLPGAVDGVLQLLPQPPASAAWNAGLPTQHDGFCYALLEKR